jgi:hypothetical protein
MKKILLLAILFILILSGCGNKNKAQNQLPNQDISQTNPIYQPSYSPEEQQLDLAKTRVMNFNGYKYDEKELKKITRSEDDHLYYYAADGKRYVFPDMTVFKSWFGDYDTKNFKVEDLQTLYKTPLGGNVTLRPGALLITPTDYNTYIVIRNGFIKPVAENILQQIYGDNWKNFINELPNYYFSQYEVGELIDQIKNFPEIPAVITINRDKGFKE